MSLSHNTLDRPQYMVPQTLFQQVFMWMTAGLLLTASVAYVTVHSSLVTLAANPMVLLIAILGQLALVFGLAAGIRRLSSTAAATVFMFYAGLNGFTLALILLYFTASSIVTAFVSTAALFGAMVILGTTTRLDLSKMGTYLIMGVVGLIIAIIVNIFLASSGLSLLISIAGVLIFTGLTAYDSQRIRRLSENGDTSGNISILGALMLYLDFINLFIFMLRLTGGGGSRR